MLKYFENEAARDLKMLMSLAEGSDVHQDRASRDIKRDAKITKNAEAFRNSKKELPIRIREFLDASRGIVDPDVSIN